MLRNPITVLGINPGTRYLAVGVVVDADLRDWRTTVLIGSRRSVKAVEVMSQLIRRYAPAMVAIKELSPSRSSPQLDRLVIDIKEYLRHERIPWREYSLMETEKRICQEGNINRKELAELLAERYPVLRHELAAEKGNKNPYHLRMFEAVALASIGFQSLESELAGKRSGKNSIVS